MAKDFRKKSDDTYKKGKYKGKKRSSNNSKRDEDEQTKFEDVSSSKISSKNDYRWYVANDQIAKDVGSFAYGYPVGSRLDFGPYGDTFNDNSVPGVACIYTGPSVGWSTDKNSPINVAAKNIYSYVRHANSGHTNYDSPDLMLYLIAMDSIYSYISYLRRVYGVLNLYNRVDRYYPDTVLRAMRINADDLRAHISDFRAFINMLSVKAGSLCVPATMSYMRKHVWLYEGLYLDSASAKPQTYLFSPVTFYKFELDENNDYAGKCTHTAFSSSNADGLFTFEELRNFANSLINPIIASEDMNIMSGDILKAYGTNLIALTMINEEYTVFPVYDPTVLDQIQNCTLVGDPVIGIAPSADNTDRWFTDVVQSQDKLWLESKPCIHYRNTVLDADLRNIEPAANTQVLSFGKNTYAMDKLVSVNNPSPDPSTTIEATRLTNVVHFPEVGTWYDVNNNMTRCYGTIPTAGSEIAYFMRVYRYGVAADKSWFPLSHHRLYSNPGFIFKMTKENLNALYGARIHSRDQVELLANQMEDFNTLIDDVNQLTNFHRHPFLYMTLTLAAGSETANTPVTVQTLDRSAILGDIDNYTFVTENNLKMLSENALLSMFNVTQFGRK